MPEKTRLEKFRQLFGIDNVIDSAKIAFHSGWKDWHEHKALKSKGIITETNKKITTAEADVKYFDEQLRSFREDGNISAKVIAKVESERQEKEEELEGLRLKLYEEQYHLKVITIDHEKFVNMRNETCRNYTSRLEAEVTPFEEKISELRVVREQLNTEIARDRESLEVCNKKKTAINNELAAEKFSSIRRAKKEIIRKLEAEARVFEKEIRAREKNRFNIDGDIAYNEERANPLRNKRKEIEMIMNRKGADISAPELKRSSVSENVPPVIGANETTSTSQTEEKTENYVRPESLKDVTLDEVVKSWNEINGSRMMVNPDKFKKTFPKYADEARANEKVSVDDFYTDLTVYSVRHGAEDRMEGMPDMQKAANKRGGFWRWLFGIKESKVQKRRLLENIKKNRNKPKTPPAIPK